LLHVLRRVAVSVVVVSRLLQCCSAEIVCVKMVFRSSSNIVAEQRKRFQSSSATTERSLVNPVDCVLKTSRRSNSGHGLGASSRPPLPTSIQLRSADNCCSIGSSSEAEAFVQSTYCRSEIKLDATVSDVFTALSNIECLDSTSLLNDAIMPVNDIVIDTSVSF